MSRNILYVVIGALVIVVAIFAYEFYQERQKTSGIEINVGKSGISIEQK
jgi:predicted negative regulator of RcsB-dependent stress response